MAGVQPRRLAVSAGTHLDDPHRRHDQDRGISLRSPDIHGFTAAEGIADQIQIPVTFRRLEGVAAEDQLAGSNIVDGVSIHQFDRRVHDRGIGQAGPLLTDIRPNHGRLARSNPGLVASGLIGH